MMESYHYISSPINYGGIELKNRIIFAPTTMGLRQKELVHRLEEIAAGGCAMIIIGDVPVSSSKIIPTLFSAKGFALYQRIAETVHKHDCLLCAQLHQSDTNMKGMFKYIPKMLTQKVHPIDLHSIMNEETSRYISSMPAEKVKEITSAFGDAAVMAVKAGFDMIQVHGDRMCGSFSSTMFNHRKDAYGGSPENRARFAVEAVRAVREKLPDIPIDYKLAVRQENPHYGNAGVLTDELSVFVPLLEQAGVTSFHVTLADHTKLEDVIPPAKHPEFNQQGCFLKFCDMVRKYTQLPICGVGSLSQPDFVEEQLKSGRIDCASMSRQLIADPEWVNKTIQNQTDKIHYCVRCNQECLGGMYKHTGVHCIYERKE